MSGGRIELPSSGLPGTNVGVIGLETGGALVSSASSSTNAEKRICSHAVPLTEATFPASVEMSYCGAAAALPALPASRIVVATATTAALLSARRGYRMNSPLLARWPLRPGGVAAERGDPNRA